jgi:nucleoside-diphosphate-sugar epimerase
MTPRDFGTGHLFCFGLGYSALALARALIAQGWTVGGTCRSEASQRDLRASGIDAVMFDRARPLVDAHSLLASADHILSSVPPDDAGDPVFAAHRDELSSLRHVRWIGYLSTTGVYGDRDGDWVDEASELGPTEARSKRRVAAEADWLSLERDQALPVHVFRLAGIYGPGRNALETVRAGKAQRIQKPGQVFSRIHVDDIARVLMASMATPKPGAVYNVCDDCPAPPDDVIAFACELLGVEAPPPVSFERAELSPMARSFYSDNKRVRNERIKRELGVSLAFPDYKVGLRHLLASMRQAG